MIFTKTKIPGVLVIDPELSHDERGDFWRVFCKNELGEIGIQFDIAQASRSYTKKKGTIRGMHIQRDPYAEDKIVSCTGGRVFDVVVDMRKDTPTFGVWVSEELSQENRKMLYIPKGCAHGFQALVDNCEMLYFMSEFYSSQHASGIRWDDPFLNISWPYPGSHISEKDSRWPLIEIS